LWAKGLGARSIHNKIFPVHGEKCLAVKAFHNWVEKFSRGRSKAADNARPIRNVEIVTEASMQRVKGLI
jgi:hypothetical protein